MSATLLRPLGRVTPAPVLRFADKPARAVRRQTLDVSDWLAEVAGDAFLSAQAAAWPASLTLGDVSQADGLLSWRASAGVPETDYQITITYTSATGRVDQQTWRCYVPAAPDLIDGGDGVVTYQELLSIDFLALGSSGADTATYWNNGNLLAVLGGILPGSPIGLPDGAVWSNGGLVQIVGANDLPASDAGLDPGDPWCNGGLFAIANP